MVTIPTNFDKALKKGAIGEDIVRKLLEAKGWIVYQPFTNGPHAFDMLATLNKERAIALDIKAKARMNKFPATGVNKKHYEQYKRFSEKHAMPFWIVFVDEAQNSIYGNTIELLDVPCVIDKIEYPFDLVTRHNVVIRLWPLEKMYQFGKLSDLQSAELKALNQRNYEYGTN